MTRKPDNPLPSLLRFDPEYERDASSGPWLMQELSRPGLGQDAASASIELSTSPARKCRVADGPLAGRAFHELAEEYGAGLVGTRGMEMTQAGFALEICLTAADTRDSPLRMVMPARGGGRGGPGFDPLRAVMILETRPGARLYCSRRRSLSEDDFLSLLSRRSGPDGLQEHEALPGQVMLAPAGLPHVLGQGILALLVSVETAGHDGKGKASGGPRVTAMTASIPASRLFIKSLGLVEGVNAVTWLYMSGLFCTARLELRSEWDDVWEGAGPRPGLVALTGFFGRGLVLAGEETEVIERGRTVVVTASCPRFRINPGPEGAIIFKTWVPDGVEEVERPLRKRGLTSREVAGLYGFFGAKT